MSYYRIYPERQNTIFRYGVYNKNNELAEHNSTTINCGANPVMELMDGKGESKLLFGFKIPLALKNKLATNVYTTKLQLWDAGTLWEPAINLKNVVLESFTPNFSEGNGYSFLPPEAKAGVSNWKNADSTIFWEDVAFTQVDNYEMNRINEDFNFTVTNSLITYLDTNSSIDNLYNLSLKIGNRKSDVMNIYRKFIHSNYTKTVFKPYLEFFIEDTITDQSTNFFALQANKVYLINKTGKSFSSNPTAKVTLDNITSDMFPEQLGVSAWYLSLTPINYSTLNKKVFCTIVWSIDGKEIQKQLLEVQTPNVLVEQYDINKVFFYPVTPLSHNVAKQGDILPYTVVSEIRGKGIIVLDSYEYKVTSMDGFEMCPWTKVSVYKNQMYFNLNTDYYFPEQQYEVFIRNKTNNFSITSNLSHKFKVTMNDKSHLRELSSSPYYSREQAFSK